MNEALELGQKMRRCSAARASGRTTFRDLAETQPRFGPD